MATIRYTATIAVDRTYWHTFAVECMFSRSCPFEDKGVKH